MDNSSRPALGQAAPVLVVYGDPPGMALEDSSGRPIGKNLVITGANQVSFERALRRGLASYFGTHVSMASARLVRISSASDFLNVVKRETFTHLIYYGHAVLGANALLPSIGKNVPGFQIAGALKGKGVKHFDMLGCETMSLAAELSLALPGVEVGYLQGWRHDNFEADRHTMQIKGVKFDQTPLHHFGVGR